MRPLRLQLLLHPAQPLTGLILVPLAQRLPGCLAVLTQLFGLVRVQAARVGSLDDTALHVHANEQLLRKPREISLAHLVSTSLPLVEPALHVGPSNTSRV